MKAFTLDEMEHAFEIGRLMQCMADDGEIEIEDSKEAFNFALGLALEFEKEHPDPEDYYTEIDLFVISKIVDRFGKES
jgi:hypothetical protein